MVYALSLITTVEHGTPDRSTGGLGRWSGRKHLTFRKYFWCSECYHPNSWPQYAMMTWLVQVLDTAIDQQCEMFTLMHEEREASNRITKTTIGNTIVGGYGNDRNGTVVRENLVNVGGTERCSYKTFICSRPSKFSGTTDLVVCIN